MKFNFTQRKRGRRRGATGLLVLMSVTLFVIPLLAFVVDMGAFYTRKAQMQKAADAAALAGAYQLANSRSSTEADASAAYYAGLASNGAYVTGVNSCAVNFQNRAFDTSLNPPVQQDNWYRVTISRPEPTFFASMFGLRHMRISATAVALYETNAEFSIKGLGTYGIAPGPVNLSLFGPDGLYSYGDCYSTSKLNNGNPNPLYTGKGYNFDVKVPRNLGYNNMTLEIFDPDCYNAGAIADAGGSDSSGNPLRIDEFRTPSGGTPTPNATDATTTKYGLYWDNNTPANPNDDVLISEKSFGFDSTTDMKWDSTFNFDISAYPTGNFRLNVLSTAGASENGFDLRVGPTRTGTQVWNPNNGTIITADGHLPINFNQSGTVNMALGDIPKQAGGGNLTITSFDTDVGARSVTYTCDQLPGQSWAGTLSTNGTFASDTFHVPDNYAAMLEGLGLSAGTWRASYQAGLQDTSVWDMSYSKAGPGSPASVKLIR